MIPLRRCLAYKHMMLNYMNEFVVKWLYFQHTHKFTQTNSEPMLYLVAAVDLINPFTQLNFCSILICGWMRVCVREFDTR